MATGTLPIDRIPAAQRLHSITLWNRQLGSLVLALIALLGGNTPAQANSHGRLGPFLEQLADAYERDGEAGAAERAAPRGLRLREERGITLVPVILEPLRGLRAAHIDDARVRARGGRVDAVSESFVRVLVPFARLRQLAEHPDVRVVRAPTAHRELGFGPIESESVGLTGAAELQQAGTTGAGIDVAVVDLDFFGLGATIAAGELPADTVIVDLPGSCDDQIEAENVHGVGVAEQVLDVAPGATLHVIKVCDEVDLENAAAYLRDNGIRIANHSVGWVNASYYDDTGPINAVVNDSRDLDDVFWSVAAGNSAERHWRGVWSDPDGNDWLNWSGLDEQNELIPGSDVCIFLNWDQYGNSATDLDLYVLNYDLVAVAESKAIQTGTQAPAEVVCFAFDPAEAPYSVAVHRWSGPTADLDVTIFSFYNDLEHSVAEASLLDPADAHGAVTVTAIFHGDYNLPDPSPAPYSSQGPTTDGRQKPDIAAPDGTSSFTYGPNGAFGTSFAAPVVAGAAALLLEAAPSLGAEDVALALFYTAIDVGPPGTDTIFGSGKLSVEIRPGCDDGVDNDGDGLVDYPSDPGCKGLYSDVEGPECDDGLDNDGDGGTDWAGTPPDPECFLTPWNNDESVIPVPEPSQALALPAGLVFLVALNRFRCSRGDSLRKRLELLFAREASGCA